MPGTPSRPRRLSLTRRLSYTAIALVMFLLMLEGFCSVLVVLKHVFFDPPLAERLHTEYDEELGWINKANFVRPDMYGPGIGMHTNSQRFRNAEDITREVPPGRLRVVVTGDSFALGYGVGDDATWCHQLSVLDPKLEVVNMGQGGYGPDQAWLWYKRVRDEFAHDVHLFTFITIDFSRMPHPNFNGYGKPVLSVRDGKLVVENTPVPRTPYLLSRIAVNGAAFRELNTYRVASRVLSPVVIPPPSADAALQQSRDVVAEIAGELQAWHRKHGSLLVFVHLPIASDYNQADLAWHDYLQSKSEEDGWIYLDLIQDLKQLPEEEVPTLFLKDGEVNFPGAAGHYNAAGSAYIARLLHRRLMEIDGFAERVERLEGPSSDRAGHATHD